MCCCVTVGSIAPGMRNEFGMSKAESWWDESKTNKATNILVIA